MCSNSVGDWVYTIVPPLIVSSQAGTTTLLGGLLVQLEEPLHESGKDYEWGYIAASVGDCKCFLYEVSGSTTAYTKAQEKLERCIQASMLSVFTFLMYV